MTIYCSGSFAQSYRLSTNHPGVCICVLGASRAINFPFSIKCFVLETEPGRAACSRRVLLLLPVRQCPADALGRFPVDLNHPGWTLVVWCNINAYGSDSYSFMPWRPMRPYQVMRCETCWKNGPSTGGGDAFAL